MTKPNHGQERTQEWLDSITERIQSTKKRVKIGGNHTITKQFS